ncbi:MAG: HEPN domain-containing protein [Ignavibacteriales bacterium]|nr:HEPN domain-containing protein [Ignavibacteriales bacterium]
MKIDFDINKTTAYWVEGSIEDLDVAKSLFNSQKFLYSLFFGHLALEKMLKALFVKINMEHAPITHSLPLLIEKNKLIIPEVFKIKLVEFMDSILKVGIQSIGRSTLKNVMKNLQNKNLKR